MVLSDFYSKDCTSLKTHLWNLNYVHYCKFYFIDKVGKFKVLQYSMHTSLKHLGYTLSCYIQQQTFLNPKSSFYCGFLLRIA